MLRRIWFGLALALPLVGQPARFRQVEKWAGTVNFELVQKGTASAFGLSEQYSYQRSAKLQVALDKYNAAAGMWEGTVSGNGEIQDQTVIAMGCGVTNVLKGSASMAKDTEGKARKFFLAFDSLDHFYFMASDSTIKTQAEVRDCQGRTTSSYERTDAVIPAMREDAVAPPTTGLSLVGSSTVTYKNATLNGMVPAPEIVWKVSWNLQPVGVAEMELLIEPEGTYKSWIPEGSFVETAAGNFIGIGARLKGPLKATRFTFELNSSREPGVASNYPVRTAWQTPTPFDMQFEKERNAEWKISNQGLRAEKEGLMTTAATRVSSFDYGGWATLKVTATLEDGRELTGTYMGERLLRLPRRSAKSLIADAWREATGEQGADGEDNDELPEGDGRKGDGLTVYEEYRGFVENGKHFRANTERKDLFIRDDIGGKTKPGIALFTKLTGLAVHHELNDQELLSFPEPHVVNLNHRDAPHLVDQHGVVIVETDKVREGALAWSAKYADVVGTPMTVDLIGISTTPGEGAAEGSVPFFDKLVAHELMHAVSVPHHGDSDYKVSMHLKRTPSGRYVLRNFGTDNLYRLYKEDGVEVSQALGEELEKRFQQGGLEKEFSAEVESGPGFKIADLIVGAEGGQHSGHEECLMRYEFASAYELKNRSDAYYFFEDKKRGGILCARPQGTGVNDAARMPQPRHGAATQGSCQKRVCVNDRYGVKR